jgi:hypothetical protein
MERILAQLHPGDPSPKVESAPADAQCGQKTEVCSQHSGAEKPPEAALHANGRESNQPLWRCTTIGFVYSIFVPYDPDTADLRKELDSRINNSEKYAEADHQQQRSARRHAIMAGPIEKHRIDSPFRPAVKIRPIVDVPLVYLRSPDCTGDLIRLSAKPILFKFCSIDL